MKTKLSALAAALSVSAVAMVAPVASAAPAAIPAPAKQTLTKETRSAQQIVKLDETTSSAVAVATELDCNTHTLTAKVTNKTKADITPKVTFDQVPNAYEYPPTIKPGKTAAYYHSFSGVGMPVEVQVQVDGHSDAVTSPQLLCNEPVSFRVDATSTSAVTGYLQNNSTMLPQTVLTRVDGGDIRTEVLAPGESRLIALPFSGFPEQRYAFVTMAVVGGYESTYSVDLKASPPIEPLLK